MINLNELIASNIKFQKIWESKDYNHRLLYFQIDPEDDGIPAHFHPEGEDSAIILKGELSYDISFKHQISANENDIVFGWTNCVHGYHNNSILPLHILVFATPDHNPSIYEHSASCINDITVRKAKISPLFNVVSSSRMTFSVIYKEYQPNTLAYNWSSKLIKEVKQEEKYMNNEWLFIQFN